MEGGEGRGATTEGRFAGACARVNYTVPPSRRLQPCLSEQQCRRVEHGSQLARAWRGSALLRCLPAARGAARETEESGRFWGGGGATAEELSGSLFLFGKEMVFSINSPTG